MLVCWETFCHQMEEQISPSAPAPVAPPQMPTGFTPEILEQMKARAREEAIRISMEQRTQTQVQPSLPIQPQVVYVRRNLTLAELLLTILLACGIVTGVQLSWKVATSFIPRIHIQIK